MLGLASDSEFANLTPGLATSPKTDVHPASNRMQHIDANTDWEVTAGSMVVEAKRAFPRHGGTVLRMGSESVKGKTTPLWHLQHSEHLVAGA